MEEESGSPHHRRPRSNNHNTIDGMDYHSMEREGIIKEESHVRSLVKGLTWRILATTTTTVIAWFVTGEIGHALKIGFFEFFAKLAIYYAHERIWTRIRL